MAIVIISSADEETRRRLAESLARKLDCPVLSREQLIEQATDSGVPVGKLEMAVLKRQAPKERLARHVAQYVAVLTTAICEQSEHSTNLVYHGRAGNMLLQGVSHVLRVRVVPNAEHRLSSVMQRVGLSREKALTYIEEVDQDVESWVRFAHGVDMNDPHCYDLMLNLDQISLESASAMTCAVAQLPDFHPTPASRRIMEDLCLTAKVRDRLGRDARTGWADLTVSARDGGVTVTYAPGQARVADDIPAVLEGLAGVQQLVATMAVTNLLWVAERFDCESQTFSEITDLARRWGAAVELLRLVPANDAEGSSTTESGGDSAAETRPGYIPKTEDPTGGIEEDTGELAVLADGGLTATAEGLIREQLYAGSRVLVGGAPRVLSTLNAQPVYSLVVVGDVFVSKGDASRVRLTRELCGLVRDGTRVPVLGADDLRESFLFDRGQILRLVSSLAGVVAIYAIVFTHQQVILDFLGGSGWQSWRWLATLAVAVTVPLVAYLYGSVTGMVLRLLKFE